ncbi:MAG: helix-turn-helix domain-containing protein, partial [Chloroflexota bacterium]|nr:helix-turn-helix domain-containing protein [Chloroflexota bacterium]
DCDGDSNRVAVYIRRLRAKIEADPAKPVLIDTVRGMGYTFRPGGAAARPALRILNAGKDDAREGGGGHPVPAMREHAWAATAE